MIRILICDDWVIAGILQCDQYPRRKRFSVSWILCFFSLPITSFVSSNHQYHGCKITTHIPSHIELPRQWMSSDR
jgi:hypothetical protein